MKNKQYLIEHEIFQDFYIYFHENLKILLKLTTLLFWHLCFFFKYNLIAQKTFSLSQVSLLLFSSVY